MITQETFNLALQHHRAGRFGQAEAIYRQALAANPDDASAHWNLALLLLLRGDFAGAWPHYSWRWRVEELRVQRVQCRQPQWDGREAGGKRILLYAEQGLGDTIQFARYVPLLGRAGARIILGCQPSLIPLLRGLEGVETVWPQPGHAPANFDVHCSLPSLPSVMGTTEATIPASVPYLAADPLAQLQRQTKMNAWPGRKIGLCWAGRPTHRDDANRSISLTQLAGLGQVPGACFFSLQKGAAAEQAARAPMQIIDWTSELNDMADTAALIANLDLVISVDTSVAHLAGAMGKPVWLLLPWIPDWRWMLERRDSPWYPTMRLFRQERPGDWNGPIGRIVEALRSL